MILHLNPLTQQPRSPKHTWSWVEAKATLTSEWVSKNVPSDYHSVLNLPETAEKKFLWYLKSSKVHWTHRLPPQVTKVVSWTVYQSRQPTSSRRPPRLSRATSSSGRSQLLMTERKTKIRLLSQRRGRHQTPACPPGFLIHHAWVVDYFVKTIFYSTFCTVYSLGIWNREGEVLTYEYVQGSSVCFCQKACW